VVLGPDYIWSIDRHNKMSPFRIKIYACINVYSRIVDRQRVLTDTYEQSMYLSLSIARMEK
jgi:hypothetical protein